MRKVLISVLVFVFHVVYRLFVSLPFSYKRYHSPKVDRLVQSNTALLYILYDVPARDMLIRLYVYIAAVHPCCALWAAFAPPFPPVFV